MVEPADQRHIDAAAQVPYTIISQGICWFAYPVSLFPEIVTAEAGLVRPQNRNTIILNQIFSELIDFHVHYFFQKENHV